MKQLCVLLAGGSGSRLWPLSREALSKQFCPVLGLQPLLVQIYERMRRLFPAEAIFISTLQEYAPLILSLLPEVTADRLLLEPVKRDTGPAVGAIAARLELLYPDVPFVCVPCDHAIGDEELFLRTIQVGLDEVVTSGRLVDVGVLPRTPNTALGYTQIGPLIRIDRGVEVFSFVKEVEKPTLERAKMYISSGEYLWHATYLMWTPRAWMRTFDELAPELATVLRQIQYGTSDEFSRLYALMPRVSVDVAVLEKMDPTQVVILKGTFPWSDIGTWEALYEHRATQIGENVTEGPVLVSDTTGSIAYALGDKQVVLFGMEDVVVVDTKDALLVCPRAKSSQLKPLLEQLKQEGKQSLL